MNQRIATIAEQAKNSIPQGMFEPAAWIEQYNLKFAELLEQDIEARHFSAGYTAGQSDGTMQAVKQCLFLCDQVDLAGADDCIAAIQDHFGVGR